MPRLQPPEGNLNLKDAVKYMNDRGLAISQTMIYKYVKQSRLHRRGPESRKQKYYSIDELNAILREEIGKIEVDTDVHFSPASEDDFEKITQICRKLFKNPVLRGPIPTETRLSWFQKEPKGHYVLKRPNGELIAYLHILALDDTRIQGYMDGKFLGKDLSGYDLQKLEMGKPVSCIVASIGSDPDIKDIALRRRHTSILLRGASREFANLGRQGIIIPRIYAFTASKNGLLMSVRMKMQQFAEPITKNRYTFWLDVLRSPTPLVQDYQHALGEWIIRNPEHAAALVEWNKRKHPGD